MSDVEWVEETDWAKVKVGDRVKIHDSGDLYEFKVRATGEVLDEPYLLTESCREFKASGDVLFVERPVVALPTEPGFYSFAGKIFELNSSGRWGHPHGPLISNFENWYFAMRYKASRLRPVDEVRAETAKEVIDLIKENIHGPNVYGQSIFDGVAEKFGVSDE